MPSRITLAGPRHFNQSRPGCNSADGCALASAMIGLREPSFIFSQIRTIQNHTSPRRESDHQTVTQDEAKQDRSPALRICVHLCSSLVLFCTDAAKKAAA